MNYENLNILLDRYEARMPEFYDPNGNDELFKWRALRCFQENWKSGEALSFAERFKSATERFEVLIDNSYQHPRNGVLKLCEAHEAEVERLFCEVLFAEDHGDLSIRQQNMDAFMEGFECLRIRSFPTHWSYKQDRHAASVYLAMHCPEENYIYKYSEAEAMAKHLEFGLDLGSGESFRLDAYYQMMDEIVSAIRKRESMTAILQKQLDEHAEGCSDPGWRLLAFDFVYCCLAYHLYRDLEHVSKSEALRRKREQDAQKEARLAKQQEREAILNEIESLEKLCNVCDEISLVNVQVTARKHGVGVVTAQERNRITVQFADGVVQYELHTKYLWLPKFESDREILDLYTRAADARDRIEVLRRRLEQQGS